jgi:hypothetical protein
MAAIDRIRDAARRAATARAAREGAIHMAYRPDPIGHVISANIARRYLTARPQRKLVAKLLRADPWRSDRATAGPAKVDGKTVATVRAELDGRAEIPPVERRTDTHGRQQPTRKPRSPEPAKAVPAPAHDERPLPFPGTPGDGLATSIPLVPVPVVNERSALAAHFERLIGALQQLEADGYPAPGDLTRLDSAARDAIAATLDGS